jgi:hypothetical protein
MKLGNSDDDQLQLDEEKYIIAYEGSLPVFSTPSDARAAALKLARNRFEDDEVDEEITEINMGIYLIEKVGSICMQPDHEDGDGEPIEEDVLSEEEEPLRSIA